MEYPDSNLQMNSALIFYIEEHTESDDIDTCLFVGWDNASGNFFIRGKRLDYDNMSYVPYSFVCGSKSDVANFVAFVCGYDSFVSVTCYNFNNILDMESSELTYEFFESHMDESYELCAYDRMNLYGKGLERFKSWLNLLENVIN